MIMWVGLDHCHVIHHLCIGEPSLPASQIYTTRHQFRLRQIGDARRPARRSARIAARRGADAADEFGEMVSYMETWSVE